MPFDPLSRHIASVLVDGDTCTVNLTGEISLTSRDLLARDFARLADVGAKRVVLQMMAVTYIDSSGIGTLIELLKQLNRRGSELVLVQLSDHVQAVLTTARLDRVFTIEPTSRA